MELERKQSDIEDYLPDYYITYAENETDGSFRINLVPVVSCLAGILLVLLHWFSN